MHVCGHFLRALYLYAKIQGYKFGGNFVNRVSGEGKPLTEVGIDGNRENFHQSFHTLGILLAYS